jgi:Prokaryotic E2 family A
MNEDKQLFSPPGDMAAPRKFKAEKARQFLDYLQACRDSATLIETRIVPEAADVVVFRLKVERPQLLANDIRREEVVAALFPLDQEIAPEVLCLRADFPSVPHVNLTIDEFARSICLYEQPYEQVRLSWTPADFLQRIHHWFAATAKGNLHADDQPLEPLIGGSKFRLILPADFNAAEAAKAAKPVSIFRIGDLGENGLIDSSVYMPASVPWGYPEGTQKCARTT